MRVRYEDEVREVYLDADDRKKLWTVLSLGDDDGLSDDEKESMLQEEFDKRFNKPEYNNWHKWNRHTAQLPEDPEGSDEEGYFEKTLIGKVADDRPFYASETERDQMLEYEDDCALVRRALAKRPAWADAYIAVRMQGVPVKEYAARVGRKASAISRLLKSAEKKIREAWEKR